MTANEAWKLARKLPEMNINDLEEVYGTRHPRDVLVEYSPEEAQKKLDDWKSRKEIQIGDEIEFYDTTNNLHRAMYVTSRFTDEDYCGICTNGDTYCVHKSSLTKTGNHIDFNKVKALLITEKKEKPATNGDMIRMMSDDELADIFGNMVENLDRCGCCPVFRNKEDGRAGACLGTCINIFSEWLKHPAERSKEQ